MAIVSNTNNILNSAELIKCYYLKCFSNSHKKKFSQYFTPSAIAAQMVSLLGRTEKKSIRILDPGAGTGILSAAAVEHFLSFASNLNRIEVVAVEIDKELNEQLKRTFDVCAASCTSSGIEFSYNILNEDFVELAYNEIRKREQNTLFESGEKGLELFDLIILNPPYKKIDSATITRKKLNALGEETSNLYTAFLSLSRHFLSDSGQLLAITPRSFCNGTYFKKFRKTFFGKFFFHRLHIYDSRNRAFSEDKILQENIIFVVSPKPPADNQVIVTTSDSPDDQFPKAIKLGHDLLINPDDNNKIIHIVTDEYALKIIKKISTLPDRLNTIGINVSTGRVVDFRVKKYLTNTFDSKATALFYPFHFSGGKVDWPKHSYKKKEAILVNDETKDMLIKSGYYTFCKRFSSKEEKKRIVAAFFDYIKFDFDCIGVENHLNYFHMNNKPLPHETAKGLTLYLNSTLVDQYFRLFNGHTQVNADDLRYLPFPGIERLNSIGNHFYGELPNQEEIDSIIEEELFEMAKDKNLVLISSKINEALYILKQLGLPKDQQNERSALTLLTLLNLKAQKKWSESQSVLIGITEIMDFIKENYHKEYKPNTRESIRRQTVHQFVQAGIVIPNPDKQRPTNSPNFVYQIEETTLNLIRTFKTERWNEQLKKYLSSTQTLSSVYAQHRALNKIPIRISDKIEIYLSSGGQNELVDKIVKDFCPYFTPKGKLIYVGDTGSKWAYFDEKALDKLGVKIKDYHGKMPDVIVYYKERNWLVLIEAVISHGPIDPKRKIELETLFKTSKIGLVFITTFLNKKTMLKYLEKIAWETDIWVADNPTHLVHLNGKRFLGPYSK
ncbi:MAG: N-6 DNA methylase [Bacteroidetes bacterium]|nr:N-6 DNA methylase [Bacteroidota bacterium]